MASLKTNIWFCKKIWFSSDIQLNWFVVCNDLRIQPIDWKWEKWKNRRIIKTTLSSQQHQQRCNTRIRPFTANNFLIQYFRIGALEILLVRSVVQVFVLGLTVVGLRERDYRLSGSRDISQPPMTATVRLYVILQALVGAIKLYLNFACLVSIRPTDFYAQFLLIKTLSYNHCWNNNMLMHI